jgi:UDP-glucose 4-epimerase
MNYSKKILITGGAGFIGCSLAETLVKNPDYYVVIVDNLLTGSMGKLPEKKYPNWKFIKCDVNKYSDIAPIMQSNNFDYVFHYAAVVGVQRTLNQPVTVLDDIQGIKNILDLSRYTGVKRVLYASSSEVYGESIEYPQHELTTPLNSRLPYAVVKNVGEAYLKSYKKEFDLDFTIFRFFNTYGAHQSEDFVISRFINAALRNEDITIYGDGLQTRTFCYIQDNVDACINAMEHDFFVNDVVNIGSDIELSINEVANEILKLIPTESKLIYKPALEEGDMRRRLPHIENMQRLLNREMTPFDLGLSNVLQVYNQNNAPKVNA